MAQGGVGLFGGRGQASRGGEGREAAGDGALQGFAVDPEFGLFTVRPPNGEWYDEIAHRLSDWLADATAEPGDAIVLMHGISARVLRGILVGLPVEPMFGAPIADSLPQGSMVMIRDGEEQIVTLGEGALERA